MLFNDIFLIFAPKQKIVDARYKRPSEAVLLSTFQTLLNFFLGLRYVNNGRDIL